MGRRFICVVWIVLVAVPGSLRAQARLTGADLAGTRQMQLAAKVTF